MNPGEECSTPSENGSDSCSNSDIFLLPVIGSDQKKWWRFPDIKCCPLLGCRNPCDDRDKAIVHFRQMHASFSILCLQCKTPLSRKLKTNIPLHYAKKHPNAKLPPNWSQLIVYIGVFIAHFTRIN